MLNLLTTSASTDNLIVPIIGIVFCVLMLCILFFILFRRIHLSKKRKKAEKRRIKQMKTEGMLSVATMPLVYGLPMPENTKCEIRTYADRFEFHGGNMDINLGRSKIVNVAVLSDVEIQHQAVSSVGGAALGYAALGPLGAAIGGRVKNRTVRTATPYLVITYRDGEELKNIGFEAAVAFNEAHKMVDEFKKFNHNTSMKIDL